MCSCLSNSLVAVVQGGVNQLDFLLQRSPLARLPWVGRGPLHMRFVRRRHIPRLSLCAQLRGLHPSRAQRDHWSVPPLKIGRPIVHKTPSAFKQVRPSVGRPRPCSGPRGRALPRSPRVDGPSPPPPSPGTTTESLIELPLPCGVRRAWIFRRLQRNRTSKPAKRATGKAAGRGQAGCRKRAAQH